VPSLLGLVPIPLLFGMGAELIALTTAMLWVHLGAMALLVLLVWKMPDDRSRAEIDR
jgi:archaellum biogenesis protein FlaJ (TadC family)